MDSPTDTLRYAPEWVYGAVSFSDWITNYYEYNKVVIPYVFGANLQKTIRATVEHEECLADIAEFGDGGDPFYANRFFAYNGYVAAFVHFTAYIQRLLPEEQTHPFIATLTRAFANRTQVSLDMAEGRIRDDPARRIM
ncbi:hypothetical protein RSAG8_08299, partial [Rhizoctonia solani AG-8 WAC10335]